MALWRLFRGWSDGELEQELVRAASAPVSFDVPVEEMTEAAGWRQEHWEFCVGWEKPGPPEREGPFARLVAGLAGYEFSDPRINVAYFDPGSPLPGRPLLLEFRAVGLRFLNGARIRCVDDDRTPDHTSWGYRYDTLVGHIERGAEWFHVSKRHRTGELRFRIDDRRRAGDFPNWWSRWGFTLVGPLFRWLWRRAAVDRLRRLARGEAIEPAGGRRYVPLRRSPAR